MSKLSFRARALDPSKPMPIYLAEELPDLQEYSAINRAVPQMPSGMEKEEESEHHLQRAICTGLIIPTPEVFVIEQEDFFDKYYPANYKMPRQMIHMQPLGLEQDIPDYDMDSADEMWVNQQMKRLDLTPLKFEHMMDRLEKSSGQTVVLLNEAKALLKQDDEVSIAVYDYWLNKRLKTQHPLILSVKTENRPGTSTNNPYLAFRRRTEKMQTRKNRKNDETSYEKMLKLKRDLQRAVTILEMVKKREKTKREHLHLSIEIFEKRYQARDFSGSLVNELSSTYKTSRPAFAPLYTNQYSHHSSMQQSSGGILSSSISSSHHYPASQYLNPSSIGDANSRDTILSTGGHSTSSRKEKRQYRKRKHKLLREKQQHQQLQQQQQQQPYSVHSSSPAPIESNIEDTEDEDILSGAHHITGTSGINGGSSEGEEEGLFAFKRKKNCEYLKPKTTKFGNWPWESKEDCGAGDPKYRFTLTSLRTPRQRCIGFARRRVGRGGRILLDRVKTNMDEFWSEFDYTIRDSRIKVELNEDEDCENENIDRDPLYLSSSSKKIENTEHLRIQREQQQQKHHLIPKLFRHRNNSEQSTSYISGGIGDQSPALTIELQSDIEESLTAVSSQQTSTDPVDVKCKIENICSASGSSYNNLNSNLILLNNRTNLNNDLNSSNSVSSSNLNANNLNNVIKTEIVLDENVSIKQEQEDAMETDTSSAIINHNATTTTSSTTTTTNVADILDDEDVNLACLSSYIKTSSTFRKNHELETSNSTPFDDFLQEVRNDWLHFRPKTPPLPTIPSTDACLVEFSEDTKIQIEMQRLRRDTLTPPSASASSNTVLLSDCDPLFLTEPFSYADILANSSCIVEQSSSSSPFSVTSTPAESPKDDVNSQSQNHQQSKQNSGIDFNLSGDSLNELNLSLGDAEDNQKVLESFLQECQIDDINQQPNFWNGILEDGNVLLDCIDDNKQKTPKPKVNKRKHWQRYQSGSSKFTIKQSCDVGQTSDENTFFKKDEPKCQVVRIEPPEDILASPPLPQGVISTTSIITNRTTSVSSSQPLNKALVTNQLQTQQQVISVPIVQPQIIQTPTNQIAVVYSTNSTNNFNFTQQPQQQILRPYSATTATPQQRLMNIKLHKQQQQRIVTQGVTQILTTNNQQQNFLQNMSGNKIYFKQDSGGQNSTAAVFTLSNVKIENNDQQSQSTNSIDQGTPLIVTTTQKQNTQQSGQPQIINVSNSTLAAAAARGGSIIIDGSIDGNGTYVLTSGLPSNQQQTQQQLQQQKRHLNGPNTVDRNALQNANRKLGRQFQIQRQPQKQVQAVQQFQIIKQEDENTEISQNPKSNNTSGVGGGGSTSNNGNFVKLSQYPIVVSELNSQQQNTISAVAANHNYSLQPSSQPIVIGSTQNSSGGGKIIFSSAGGNTTGHVIPHLKEMPTTNLKVNLVSNSNQQQQQQQSPQIIQQTTANQQQSQQQQTRVKLDKNSGNMYIDQSDGNSTSQQKRVVYSKLRLDGSQITQYTTTAQLINKNKFPIINMRPLQQHQIITATAKSNPAGAGVATAVVSSQPTDKLNNFSSSNDNNIVSAASNASPNSTTGGNSINR